MWGYSGSDSDDDASSRYCTYCGEAYPRRPRQANNIGVCGRCSRVLKHLTDNPGNRNISTRAMSAEGKTSAASSLEDRRPSLDDTENGESDDEGKDEEGRPDPNDGIDGVTLCPRCWENPPTTKLYDVPVCQKCLQKVNEQKVSH